MTHPITPPPELVRQWTTSSDCPEAWGPKDQWIASKAAQWGADQELKACLSWLQARIREGWNPCHLEDLRAARRPKPPSLKEQALKDLNELLLVARQAGVFNPPDNILRALEALPND